MDIILFDTEFFSLSKKKTKLELLKKYSNILYPEILQLAAYKYKNFFLNNKPKKINLFFKTKQKIPKRIINLTGINEKIIKVKGKYFNNNIYNFLKLIEKKTIVCSNGNDFEIVKLNMKYNNTGKINKNIIFVDLKKIIGFMDMDKRYSKFTNIKIRSHDALNDCLILKLSIDEYIKKNGKKAFVQKINKQKKLIKL